MHSDGRDGLKRRRGLLTLACLVLTAACKNSVPRPGADTSTAAGPQVAQDHPSPRDQAELVIPAPPDFKPVATKPYVRLKLKFEKAILHRGETPRFRLELTNVGPEPALIVEDDDSFFKTCSLLAAVMDHRIHFRMTGPDGKTAGLRAPTPMGDDMVMDEIHFPAGWTDAQKKVWAQRHIAESRAANSLNVRLDPGDTLHTRGDGPASEYCPLDTDPPFTKPGTYAIRAVFDDAPPAFDESEVPALVKRGVSKAMQLKLHELEIKSALGHAESESVSFEVAP